MSEVTEVRWFVVMWTLVHVPRFVSGAVRPVDSSYLLQAADAVPGRVCNTRSVPGGGIRRDSVPPGMQVMQQEQVMLSVCKYLQV